MFVGHLAVGLAAKRVAPDTNLGWLIAGVIALDLIWPVFVLTGIEHVRIEPGATAFTPLVFESYPWSHSLLMAFVWGLVLVGIARLARARVAPWVLVALVASHWVLDFLSHAPDMPLWPGGSPRYGLAMWDSIPATFLVEGTLWIAGIALYLQQLGFQGRRPGWVFWSFIAVSTVMWATSPWSPPPPSVAALGWFALVGWITVPWAAWADQRARGKA